MELKNAIINLLDAVTDENLLMYFYALLRRATSDVDTETVLGEIFTYQRADESSQQRDGACLEAS